MLSGPDLITYISVPLTLTGVVQIYILCKAIWIYYKLYRSVPNKLRSFYSFYPDPSSGTVLVIAPTIVCINPGLWHETPPPKFYHVDAQEFRNRGFWGLWGRRKTNEPVLPTVQDWDEKKLNRCHLMPSWMSSQTKISLEPRRFRAGEPKDLLRPWMETATSLGFRLNQAKDVGHGEFHKWAKDMRITVGIDMGIAPQKLAMPWKTFVWFALAIGTNPFDLDPREHKSKFKHMTKHGVVLMRLSRVGDDWNFALDADQYYEYSVRRALALVNAMCFERNGSTICRFLGSPDEFKLTPDFFRRPDHFTTQTTPLGSTSAAGAEAQGSPSAVGRLQAASLTWIFYKEHLAGRPHHGLGGDLLVCQWMLEAQQRSLMFLCELDRAGMLESRLPEVLFQEPPSGDEPSASSARELLKVLRHDFHSSAYLTASYDFLHAVRETAQRMTASRQSAVETAPASGAEDIQQLLHKWDQPFDPPQRHAVAASPEATAAEIKVATQRISTRRNLLSEIARGSRFAQLRDAYDPHPHNTATAQQQQQQQHAVENVPFPSADVALTAHVYLAIQPWQHHQRTAWELRPRIKDALQQTLKGERATRSSFDVATAAETLDRVGEDAKSGVYSAPWERDAVFGLLRSEDVPQVVFLL